MSSYEKNQVKSVGAAQPNAQAPLQKLVEKSQDDKVTYYDPRGWVTGEPVNAREKLYEAENWEEKFNQVNEMVTKGVHPREAVKAALDTGRVSLPVYTVEDLFVSDGFQKPLVDGLARVAVDTEEIELDEVTDVAEGTSFTEGGDITKSDDTIAQHSYTIENQGIVKDVTDKLIHTGRYGSPQSTTVELGAEGVKRYLEKQAHQGTNHDTNGFPALADWASANGYNVDKTGSTLNSSIVGELITELEALGTARSNMMVTTDPRSFRNLKDDLQDYQRFESPEGEINFGFQALEFEGVMISQTQGTPSATGSRELYAFDASGTFWGVLADVTMKPLAETSDSLRETAVYTHMSLVSEAQKRVARAYNMD